MNILTFKTKWFPSREMPSVESCEESNEQMLVKMKKENIKEVVVTY